MDVKITGADKYTLITVSGRLDASTSDNFQNEAITKTDGIKNLLLDMSDLEYISSSGLRSILVVAKRTDALSGFFALTGAGGTVMDVLKLSGFDGLIKMYPSVSEAAKHIS